MRPSRSLGTHYYRTVSANDASPPASAGSTSATRGRPRSATRHGVSTRHAVVAAVRYVACSQRTVALASFVGLVLALWAPFGPRSGLGYETGFPAFSDMHSWWDGFFFDSDPLRPYTSVLLPALVSDRPRSR